MANEKRGVISNAKVSCGSIDEFQPADITPPFKEEEVLSDCIGEDGNKHDIPTGNFKIHPIEFQVPETKNNDRVKKLREYQKEGKVEDWTYTEFERASGTVLKTQSLGECTLTEMKPDNKGMKNQAQAFAKFKLMPATLEDIE